MKIPRDLSGAQLSKLLECYGYTIVRQTGSHIRLSSMYQGCEHKVTIPAHNPIKIGTLSSILADVANYLKMDRKSIAKELFE